MPTTYIPRPDADFAAFADSYYNAVKLWWIARGLNLADLSNLKNSLFAWDAAYPVHVAAQNAAEAAKQTKTATRALLEKEIRPIANFIQTYPSTTNADRAKIGITVRQPGGGGGTSPVPSSRPLVQVEWGDRLRHTIRFTDESTPTRRARPKNTLGAEVRLKLVDSGDESPIDPETMQFVTLATSGKATTTFPLAAHGKTAVYVLRWVGPRGAVGPWSEAASATVAA